MDKHEEDDGRPANDGTRRPQDFTERQHQRELLAERIGQLLARCWLQRSLSPGTNVAGASTRCTGRSHSSPCSSA